MTSESRRLAIYPQPQSCLPRRLLGTVDSPSSARIVAATTRELLRLRQGTPASNARAGVFAVAAIDDTTGEDLALIYANVRPEEYDLLTDFVANCL